ncbi:hypothetical protein [Agriterribacter sp.]|nr:hypothetical protein [Agriterribacter sp.]HTN08711.1 hypothetical protein [Agriterribacter sp.]
MVATFDANSQDAGEAPSFISRYDEKELVKLVQTLLPGYRNSHFTDV